MIHRNRYWVTIFLVILICDLTPKFAAASCPMIFQPKEFLASDDKVSVRGTATSDVLTLYNSHWIVCYKKQRECWDTDVEGGFPMARDSGICSVEVGAPTRLTAERWTPDLIIATYSDDCGSSGLYIIDRNVGTVTVDERTRVTSRKPKWCADWPRPMHWHWTIDDPPFWKEVKSMA